MDDTDVIRQGIVAAIDTEQAAKQLEQAFKEVRIHLLYVVLPRMFF